MTDHTIEQEIQAKGLTAPRVTPDHIDATVSWEQTFTAGDALRALGYPSHQAFDLLTICVLKLVNDFTVIGESACASPENFDRELGAKIARQNAVNKIWPLEGYLLKSKLLASATDAVPSAFQQDVRSILEIGTIVPPHQQRVIDEKTELDGKFNKLVAFFDNPLYKTLHIDEQARLAQQCEYMGKYSEILKDRIGAF